MFDVQEDLRPSHKGVRSHTAVGSKWLYLKAKIVQDNLSFGPDLQHSSLSTVIAFLIILWSSRCVFCSGYRFALQCLCVIFGRREEAWEQSCLWLCSAITSGKKTQLAQELIMQLPTQTWFCGKLPVIINCSLYIAPLSCFFHLLGKKGIM